MVSSEKVEVKIIEAKIEEIKLFDVQKRIREALEGLEREFKEYKTTELNIGIEVGIPSGVKGSISVKLEKR